MQIAVISDLHLGGADRTDTFGHDDGEFLRFLSYLESNFERIVLLGDIWETLTGPHLAGPARSLGAARSAHPEIAKRFLKQRFLYVHGNHDLVAGTLERAPESLVIREHGTRILFTHGHQHDFLIQKARWLSELGIWIGGWLLRLGLSPVYRTLSALDMLRSGASRDGSRCSFQRWAMAAARMREADVVVTGHTHVATRNEHGDRLFLNSGSCAEGRFSFASLDTLRGAYAVHESW